MQDAVPVCCRGAGIRPVSGSRPRRTLLPACAPARPPNMPPTWPVGRSPLHAAPTSHPPNRQHALIWFLVIRHPPDAAALSQLPRPVPWVGCVHGSLCSGSRGVVTVRTCGSQQGLAPTTMPWPLQHRTVSHSVHSVVKSIGSTTVCHCASICVRHEHGRDIACGRCRIMEGASGIHGNGPSTRCSRTC